MIRKWIHTLFHRKTYDEMFDELGYEWLSIGSKGVAYEKYLGQGMGKTDPQFKVIRIEKSENGDYIVTCCKKEGLAGVGHVASWLTEDELRACCKAVKRLKR